MGPSRRDLIAAAAVAAAPSVAAPEPAPEPAPDDFGAPWLQAVLERYAAFGDKASGGAGDDACGAWLEGELQSLGYATARRSFPVPYFEPALAALICGEARAEVVPQALVVATGPEGLVGPLKRADWPGDLAGAIAVVALPFKRWTSLADPEVSRALADAFQRGAAAAVLITTGPTGEAIALDVSPQYAGFDRPVAILAPKDAAPFVAAAGEGWPARLIVTGRGGLRPAFDLVARFDREAPKTVILSTPRSGWFSCAAERGSGVAVWLSLARWLLRSEPAVNVQLICTTGHEYGGLGGEQYLAEQAPPPTGHWVHIGASAAARDWNELGPSLRPLPSADPQRTLAVTRDLLDPVRGAFKGVSGLEAASLAEDASAGGELNRVLKAGYPSAIGVYGGHRYFHTRGDDLRCVSGELVRPVAVAFRSALSTILARSA